jgi:uncharacterized protein (TIGR01777 family)
MRADHGNVFALRSSMPVSAEDLFAWHARPGAFARLAPPWESIRLIGEHPGLVNGAEVEMRLRRGPLRLTWVARHRAVVPGHGFVDEQVRGPFARWIHAHRFLPEGDDSSTLEDTVNYVLPFGAVGDLVGGRSVRRSLERTFAFRHRRTLEDLTRHRDARLERPLRVAVTGASGMIGAALTAFLTSGGHEVVPLVRRAVRPGERAIAWHPERGTIDAAALEGFDAVVNLAGANVGEGRWTPVRKELLRRSRTEGTALLSRTLAALARPPRVLVSASAVGYYGDRGDEPLTEASHPGEGFFPDLSRAWEDAARPAEAAGIRVVHPRIGVVLAGNGGMLARLAPVIAAGGGAIMGDGLQKLSWIAFDDLLGIFHTAIYDARLRGPINATAPRAVSQAEFTHALGRVLRRPVFLRAPAKVIRAALGEMGEALILEGADVRPARLQDLGFRFAFPDLEETLRMELGRFAGA